MIVLAVTSGESLGEHDYRFDHGEFVYDATIRVDPELGVLALMSASERTDAGGGVYRFVMDKPVPHKYQIQPTWLRILSIDYGVFQLCDFRF